MDYRTVFNRRGNTYHEAMRQYPSARWQEFENIFQHVDRSVLRDVLDIPSGGGYLAPHLPPGTRLHECDPSAPFAIGKSEIQVVDLEDPQLPANAFDLVVNLAAIHHIHQKNRFFHALIQTIRPGAHLVIGDVWHDSPIASFLDDFVGSHNGTGHAGEYLSGQCQHDFDLDLSQVELVNQQVMPCRWSLATVQQLVQFCQLLFNVHGVSAKELEAALHEYVGFQVAPHAAWLQWELVYYTFRKAI